MPILDKKWYNDKIEPQQFLLVQVKLEMNRIRLKSIKFCSNSLRKNRRELHGVIVKSSQIVSSKNFACYQEGNFVCKIISQALTMSRFKGKNDKHYESWAL